MSSASGASLDGIHPAQGPFQKLCWSVGVYSFGKCSFHVCFGALGKAVEQQSLYEVHEVATFVCLIAVETGEQQVNWLFGSGDVFRGDTHGVVGGAMGIV